VPASSLGELADGPICIGSTFSPFGNAAIVGGLLSKDTTAPEPPTANVAEGTYTSEEQVLLSAAKGTIHYTTDGSAPAARI
jgi:hypothetical protein